LARALVGVPHIRIPHPGAGLFSLSPDTSRTCERIWHIQKLLQAAISISQSGFTRRENRLASDLNSIPRAPQPGAPSPSWRAASRKSGTRRGIGSNAGGRQQHIEVIQRKTPLARAHIQLAAGGFFDSTNPCRVGPFRGRMMGKVSSNYTRHMMLRSRLGLGRATVSGRRRRDFPGRRSRRGT